MPVASPAMDRERNGARSREAILDAAEALFAERGYTATGVADVGRRAGLSRATPAYFFGSKAELYRAVLERCFTEARAAVRRGQEHVRANPEEPEAILASVIRDYFDFLAARPGFVRLLEREALGDRPGGEDPSPAWETGREAVAAIVEELGFARSGKGGGSREAEHLLLSIVSLCWFPLVHAGTLVPSIGLDLRNRRRLEERRQHVVDLILHGVAGRLSAGRAPAQREARRP